MAYVALFLAAAAGAVAVAPSCERCPLSRSCIVRRSKMQGAQAQWSRVGACAAALNLRPIAAKHFAHIANAFAPGCGDQYTGVPMSEVNWASWLVVTGVRLRASWTEHCSHQRRSRVCRRRIYELHKPCHTRLPGHGCGYRERYRRASSTLLSPGQVSRQRNTPHRHTPAPLLISPNSACIRHRLHHVAVRIRTTWQWPS